ncbi:MAG: hypothetical protein ACUVTY_08755 [Armatimonadota bacterium]
MQTAWQNRFVWVLGAVVAIVAVLALWQRTQAQVEVPAVPNPPVVAAQPGQPLPPPPGPGQPFPGQPFPGIAERVALGQVAVAANNEYVYVVRGNMLYQFSAKDLKLINSAELPRPQIRRPAAGAQGQQQTQPRLRRRLQDQGQPPAQR